MAVILLASPIYLLVFYKYNHYEISEKKEDFMRKYSPLMEEFDLNSKFKLYYPLFFVEKIIFMFILYNGGNYPYAQVATCFFLQVFNIVFMIKYRVFKNKSSFKTYIFQESLILCIFVMVAQFFFEFPENVLTIISYGIIGSTGLGVGISSLSSISDLYTKVKEIIRKRQAKNQIPAINVVAEGCDSSFNKLSSRVIKEKPTKDYIKVVPYNSNINSPSSSMAEDKSFIVITH